MGIVDQIQRSSARVQLLNTAGPRRPARYVLYWAQANRRLDWNQALAFAADLANRWDLPLLVYEGLTFSHPFANDRFHTFVMEGVPENEHRAAGLGLGYVFHLRRTRSDPNDALYRLAADAAAVVTDDFPSYIVREHNRSVPTRIGIPYYAVDASCIVPMALLAKQEYAARTIRPKIQRMLGEHLRPLDPVRVKRRWDKTASGAGSPLHTPVTAENIGELVATSEIDHTVPPSAGFRGGRTEGLRCLRWFLGKNLVRYAKLNREPSAQATSRLSPYLHFGHVSPLEVALAVRAYRKSVS